MVDDVLSIGLSRHYRQGDTNQGVRAFGLNTQLGYQMFLTGDVSTYQYAELNLADGGRVRFTRISSGTGYADAVMEHTATPTRFHKARLTWNPAHGWEIALKDGTVYEFVAGNPGSLLTAIRDRVGNRLTIARYGPHNLLISRITSPNGRWVEFTWDPGGQWFITQVRDNAGRTVSYTYDGTARLASVTDANSGVTSYTYNTNHQMLTVTDPKSLTYLTNTYAAGSGLVADHEPDAGGRDDIPVRVHGRWDGEGDADGRDGPAGDGAAGDVRRQRLSAHGHARVRPAGGRRRPRTCGRPARRWSRR